MKQNGIGGANTKTGLIFEGKTDLKTFLNQQKNYFVDDNNEVFYNGESVAFIFKKYGLYNRLIEELNLYLDFILNAKCIKAEIHYQGSIKAFITNCIEDTEDFIDNMLLNKMIHY